jgi:chemotaxis protein MotB
MDDAPVIIKKVKKVQGHGHHGGSWKVAYADFVTAMMAFFLLLWLLNVTTDEQKNGIADYFAPSQISSSRSGAGGILGGRTIISDGNRVSNEGAAAVVVGLSPPPEPDAKTKDQSDSELAKRLAEREQETFRNTANALRQAIQESPDQAELARHLVVDMTPEGMRIQLVDQEMVSMFPSGSANMNEQARRLMQTVAKVVSRLPNTLSVTGHTDAQPYRREGGYSNWELSADRANASRRALVESGIPPNRIVNVTGKAEREPLFPDNPLNPSNRRISIVLLREAGVAPGSIEPTSALPPPLRR